MKHQHLVEIIFEQIAAFLRSSILYGLGTTLSFPNVNFQTISQLSHGNESQ